MSYRVAVIVVDESVPLVGADRPEVVKAVPLHRRPYKTRAVAIRLAARVARAGKLIAQTKVFTAQELPRAQKARPLSGAEEFARELHKAADTVFGPPQRCPARSPGGQTPDGRLPRKGTQCGNYAGHDGAHTVLIPTGAPWWSKEKP